MDNSSWGALYFDNVEMNNNSWRVLDFDEEYFVGSSLVVSLKSELRSGLTWHVVSCYCIDSGKKHKGTKNI